LIHGVAFLCGISTPSLSAQGEQRRLAYFNIDRDNASFLEPAWDSLRERNSIAPAQSLPTGALRALARRVRVRTPVGPTVSLLILLADGNNENRIANGVFRPVPLRAGF